MDKIELLKKITEEKWELYNIFDEKGNKEIASSYYWEWSALYTALQILTNEEYYKYRLKAYK